MKILFLFLSIILISFSTRSQNRLLDYDFSNVVGDTVFDDSGSNNDGLLVGSFKLYGIGVVKFKAHTIGYLEVPPVIDGLYNFSIHMRAEIVDFNLDSLNPVNTFFSASTPDCIYCFGLNYDRANLQWELTMNGTTHVFPQAPIFTGDGFEVRVIRDSGIVSLYYYYGLIGSFYDATPLQATTFIFGQREQCLGGCYNTNKGIRGGFNHIQIAKGASNFKESDQLTTASSLSVFPDPFTSSATISFSSPQQASATIALYDLAGRKVQTVFEGTVEAGTQEVELNRNELTSGIYFLQLKLNNEVIIKTIVIE
jgi:hypothetical protein